MTPSSGAMGGRARYMEDGCECHAEESSQEMVALLLISEIGGISNPRTTVLTF